MHESDLVSERQVVRHSRNENGWPRAEPHKSRRRELTRWRESRPDFPGSRPPVAAPSAPWNVEVCECYPTLDEKLRTRACCRAEIRTDLRIVPSGRAVTPGLRSTLSPQFKPQAKEATSACRALEEHIGYAGSTRGSPPQARRRRIVREAPNALHVVKTPVYFPACTLDYSLRVPLCCPASRMETSAKTGQVMLSSFLWSPLTLPFPIACLTHPTGRITHSPPIRKCSLTANRSSTSLLASTQKRFSPLAALADSERLVGATPHSGQVAGWLASKIANACLDASAAIGGSR